jgi:hypothetical protein
LLAAGTARAASVVADLLAPVSMALITRILRRPAFRLSAPPEVLPLDSLEAEHKHAA